MQTHLFAEILQVVWVGHFIQIGAARKIMTKGMDREACHRSAT